MSNNGTTGLGKKSAGLGKKSQNATLNKQSVISLVKKSLALSSFVQEEESELPWWSLRTGEDVVQELCSSISSGLTSEDAARRLEDFGPNKLSEAEKPSFLKKLWHHLNNIIIWLLLAAAVVEGALQSWAEFGLILVVVLVNTAIGMVQEGRAEKAADAIKAMLSPNALVLRDGQQAVIPAADLVPGDIVLLKSGDKVPADLRLVAVTNLQIQEAMLTGESVPVSKNLEPVAPAASLGDRKCMAYSATNVAAGTGRGVVVATGDNAEIGCINRMVNTVDNVRNNLLHQLDVLGRWLVTLVLCVGLMAFLLALLHADEGFETAFESAVSIAVAIIPEGLPAVVTIVLAIGTTVMARNNAIIRQLPAVETLGSLNTICSDKTGTLTKNEMTVVAVRTAAALYTVSGVGYEPVGTFAASPSSPTPSSPSTAAALPTSPSTAAALPTSPSTAASPSSPSSSPSPPPPPPLPPLDELRMAGLRRMLEGAVLCNDSALTTETDPATGRTLYKPLGAPTEVALLVAGEKAGLPPLPELRARCPRVGAVPFESEHKFMATVHEEEDAGNGGGSGGGGKRRVVYVKGAPDRLLPLCSGQVDGDDVGRVAPLDAAFWHAAQAELGSQGLRVLALCRAELPADVDPTSLSASGLIRAQPFLSLVMLLAILDPPREEAVAAIKVAHAAGITVKMITGDHSLTALAIGRMLGIDGGGGVVTGPEIDETNDDALTHLVARCNIFARASPENKLRIVRALQASRLVVAMTGDGVNDAPALKAADCGVAMGITGTDVSKEAAKMVLADDNFASIVAAVREGRRVWDNIRKILIFNLPVNLAQGLSVLYAYILGFHQVPLTALQVLLVNLITSVTLGLALAAEPPEPNVMSRPPRRAGKRLVGKLLLWRMFFVCHVVVCLVIGMFYWAGQLGYSLRERRAEAFCVLVGAQVSYFFNCRFIKMASFHPRVFLGNRIIYLSASITLGLMVFVTYVPGVNEFFKMAGMDGLQWARVVVCMAVVFGVVEVEKALVDPLLMPLLRPVLKWMEDHSPDWLSVDSKAVLARLSCGSRCFAGGPSKVRAVALRRHFSAQRKGVTRHGSGGREKATAAATTATTSVALSPTGSSTVSGEENV